MIEFNPSASKKINVLYGDQAFANLSKSLKTLHSNEESHCATDAIARLTYTALLTNCNPTELSIDDDGTLHLEALFAAMRLRGYEIGIPKKAPIQNKYAVTTWHVAIKCNNVQATMAFDIPEDVA